MADISSIVTTILANGATDYSSRIPSATRDNIIEVANAILDYQPAANDFLTGLLNKIVLQLVQNKSFRNPLSMLKKGGKPYGFDIENSYVNPASASAYDASGSTLLSTSTPDVKTEYFRINRRDMYKTTIYPDSLRHAFTGPEAMNNLVDGITNSLYNGDFIDEFILMKNMFADAILNQKMKTASITAVTDAATATAFVTAVKNLASAFQYPSTAFNGWAKAGGGGNAVNTFCMKENQILVLRSDILNYVDVNVLAAAFNLGKVDFQNRVIETDNFGECSNVVGILLDEAAVHVWDDKNEGTVPWFNPQGLYYNWFWHHWQTFAISMLANAVAIVDDASAPNAPVLTENTLQNGEDDPAGSATTGCRVFFEVWNAEETILICRHSEIVANNAWTFALDDALVTGQHIIAWQVDMAGNKSATDTYTVDAGA